MRACLTDMTGMRIVDLSHVQHIYVAVGRTDMRCGIDKLASIVQGKFQLDPCANAVFLFGGRRNDRFKALYWDEDGFLLLYKRLEQGRFQWPKDTEQLREITLPQFTWLMDGLSVDQPKAHKPLKGGMLFV